MIVSYDLWQFGVPEREIHGILLPEGTDPTVVARLATRGEANYLIVQDNERVMDEVTDTGPEGTFGLAMYSRVSFNRCLVQLEGLMASLPDRIVAIGIQAQ